MRDSTALKHEFDLASVDHVLNTTRSVRKRLDLSRPVPRKLVEEALEIALQAPTGANTQTWRFLVVEDQEKREKIADFYQRGVQLYVDGETGLSRTGVTINKEFEATDLRHSQKGSVLDSSVYLMEHLAEVPLFIIPCIESRFDNEDVFTQASMWGSILPSTWSLMLALRARQIASAWTTIHLVFEKEIAEILSIPENYTQAALLPVAWLKGNKLHKAKRLSLNEVAFWDNWGDW